MKKQTKTLHYIIQGNYGYGWEDESSYDCGENRRFEVKAKTDCYADLKEYRKSYAGGIYRVIKRYE